LDESALRTDLTWKLKPGALNDAPTHVRLMVEMAFRLF
jgi:hypothetical protein